MMKISTIIDKKSRIHSEKEGKKETQFEGDEKDYREIEKMK